MVEESYTGVDIDRLGSCGGIIVESDSARDLCLACIALHACASVNHAVGYLHNFKTTIGRNLVQAPLIT